MEVNPPPIQEKTINSMGVFPQVWVRWLVSVRDAINGLLEASYWFDDNDTATTAAPINHIGGATNTHLTNDGAGSFSNAYNSKNRARIWDASRNEFDFSSLKIGDSIVLRVDCTVTHAVNNQEMKFFLELGSGAEQYELLMHYRYDKSSGTDQITFIYEFYIGNENTLNSAGKIRFESDDNASIVVNGWYTRIISA